MNTVKCPNCGKDVKNPGNTEIVVCPDCQAVIEVEES